MLKEVSLSRESDRSRRRWFVDEELELIVWLSDQGSPDGFQLCYDRGGRERALTWTEGGGYSHDRVDDGEGNPTKNSTPILVSDGPFPAAQIVARFEKASVGVEPQIRQFVAQKLRAYATSVATGEVPPGPQVPNNRIHAKRGNTRARDARAFGVERNQ